MPDRPTIEELEQLPPARLAVDLAAAELEIERLREENRHFRLRTHDAEVAVDMYVDGNRRRNQEMQACYRLIRRLWKRQLPDWSGMSWEHPEDPPDDERHADDPLHHRETAHLIRAVCSVPTSSDRTGPLSSPHRQF